DGRVVAFEDERPDLVTDDNNNANDVFVIEVGGSVERVSVDSQGKEGTGPSYYPAISEDGRFVSFFSNSNLAVTGPHGPAADIFLRDRCRSGGHDVPGCLPRTMLVSARPDGVQGSANGRSTMSSNGRFIAFESSNCMLFPSICSPTNNDNSYEVYVR